MLYIAKRVVAHVKEYFYNSASAVGGRILVSNFSSHDGPFLFISAIWFRDSARGGTGFLVSHANSNILVAGCCNLQASSELDAHLKALILVIKYLIDSRIHVRHLFTSSQDLYTSMKNSGRHDDWRIKHLIRIGVDSLPLFGSPYIHVIPRGWDAISLHLARHGVGLHELSFFHQGRELPRWLMKCVLANGFSL